MNKTKVTIFDRTIQAFKPNRYVLGVTFALVAGCFMYVSDGGLDYDYNPSFNILTGFKSFAVIINLPALAVTLDIYYAFVKWSYWIGSFIHLHEMEINFLSIRFASVLTIITYVYVVIVASIIKAFLNTIRKIQEKQTICYFLLFFP